MTESDEQKRRNELRDLISVPGEKVNIDMLMDVLVALYTDINSSEMKKNKNISDFIKRYERYIHSLQKLRTRVSDYETIKVIGQGAFGVVKLVRHKNSKKVYAMKSLSKSEMFSKAEQAFFWTERDIMAKNLSPWIVTLYNSFQDSKFLYMVMEFMPGGDLVNLMSQYDVHDKWAKFYTAEMVLAINAIHEMGFIHRDVKPDNMLLDSKGHIKIADFGTCMKMDAKGKVTSDTAVGTPDYISPEVLTSQGKKAMYGREVDFWSVGIVMFEMLQNETPFWSEGLVQTYGKIIEFEKNLSFEDTNIKKDAESLIRGFLSDSSRRLGRNGIAEIKAHPFFKTDEWDWDTMREYPAPWTFDLKSEIDTQNFEDIEETKRDTMAFQSPAGYVGNQLVFVGFSYSNNPEWLDLAGKPSVTDGKLEKPQLSKKTSLSSSQQFDTAEVKRLKEKLRKTEDKNRAVEMDLRVIKQQVEKEKEQVEILEKRNRNLDEAKRMLEREISDVNTKTGNDAQRFNQLQAEIKLLKSKELELNQRTKRDQEQFRILSREKEDKNQKYQTEQEQSSKLRKEIQLIKNQKNDLEAQIRDLNLKQKQSQDELRRTTNEKKSLEVQLKDFRDHNHRASAQLEIDNKRLTENSKNTQREHEQALKRIKTQNETLTRKLQTIENEKTELRKKVTNLELEVTKSGLEASKTEALRVSKQRLNVESEMQQLREETNLLQSRLSNAEYENKQKQDLLSDMTSQIEQLRSSLKTKEMTSDELEKERMVLKRKLAEVEGEQETKLKYATLTVKQNMQEEIGTLRGTLEREKVNNTNLERQLQELQEQHETAQYFSNLYKSQVREHKDEIEDARAELELEKSKLTQEKADAVKDLQQQLQMKDQYFNDEKQRIHSEHDQQMRQSREECDKYSQRVKTVEDALFRANDSYEDMRQENIDLIKEQKRYEQHIEHLEEEMGNWEEEREQHKKDLRNETLLKQQAINKLVQVTTEKNNRQDDFGKKGKGVTKDELRKAQRQAKDLDKKMKEKELSFASSLRSKETQIEELNSIIAQETQRRQEQEMELQSKTMELETLIRQGSYSQSNDSIVHSMSSMSVHSHDGPKEGLLELPSDKGIKYGWVKTIVCLHDNKLFFYAGDTERKLNKPKMIIDIEKLFHVRKVSPIDAFRANQRDIPRMFQIIYGNEGKTSSSGLHLPSLGGDSGHKLLPIQYRAPGTHCDLDSCPKKSLWSVMHPPQALVCRKCNMKIHKHHMDNEPHKIPPCKENFDLDQAVDLLLMAPTPNEQKDWINAIQKAMPAHPPVAPSANPNFDNRGSPVMASYRSFQQRLKR